MTENVPAYVSVVFIITTFVTVGFLVRAIQNAAPESFGSKLILFLVPFWLIFTAILALQGFFTSSESVPPRVFLFGVFPALLLIAALFIFYRSDLIERLPLTLLTLLHLIRVPVELVLLWLFQAGTVPRLMTFEGNNFDILSGITAPLVYYLAFRGRTANRPLLIVWNILALGLLANVVVIAALSIPSPVQKLSIDMPNIAVMYFPFIWLPAVVVPIVLFAHLAALWKLFRNRHA